jgi:diguanylate cyclase (GGDEF)-like protein
MLRFGLRGALFGLLTALGLAVALGLGWFLPGSAARLLLQLVSLLAPLLLLALRFSELLRTTPRAALLQEIEAGALFLGVCYASISLAGGARGPLAPLPFLVLAAICSAMSLGGAGALCLVAVIFEGASWSTLPPDGPWAARIVFLFLFGLSFAGLVGAELRRLRANVSAELARLKRRFTEDAHEFRLLDTGRGEEGTPRRGDAQEMLARASVDSVRQTLYFTLELLKKALGLHAVGLLWLTPDGERLKLKEALSDAELYKGPFGAGEGLFGSIVRQRRAVSLRRTRESDEPLPYYAQGAAARAFLGVPVTEGPHLRGLLFADRLDDRPFTSAEEEALGEAAREVLRAIQFERLFADAERERRRQASFFGASRALLVARSVEEVLARALSATRELVGFDFGAITLYDAGQKRHTLAHVLGEEKEHEGYSFADNIGLAAMVVKNRHYLPAYGELRDPNALVFDAKVKLKGYESLLLLPLIRPSRNAGEQASEALGTLALGSKRGKAFPADVREMLEVIAGQIAQSLENAYLYEDMHRQATIDGLTGLLNRRTLMQKFDEALARAERHKRRVALILTDVDFFKKVNDNHGHPAGDEVLRGVSKSFRETLRKIDLVGRYGGEEFCILLEEADSEGALLMAERLREEVKRLQFASEKGAFQVTISLGIALYPSDGTTKETLIEQADQALYYSKHNGRNQANLFASIPKKKVA